MKLSPRKWIKCLLLNHILEEQRRDASNVLLMRGKVDAGSTGPSHGDPKPKFNGAISIAESRPRGCFRCGYTSHRIKDCKIPGSINAESVIVWGTLRMLVQRR